MTSKKKRRPSQEVVYNPRTDRYRFQLPMDINPYSGDYVEDSGDACSDYERHALRKQWMGNISIPAPPAPALDFPQIYGHLSVAEAKAIQAQLDQEIDKLLEYVEVLAENYALRHRDSYASALEKENKDLRDHLSNMEYDYRGKAAQLGQLRKEHEDIKAGILDVANEKDFMDALHRRIRGSKLSTEAIMEEAADRGYIVIDAGTMSVEDFNQQVDVLFLHGHELYTNAKLPKHLRFHSQKRPGE